MKKQENSMLVNVIGLGYIGLPTALMMASHGVNVIGTDYNKKLVEQLQTTGKVFEEKASPNCLMKPGGKASVFPNNIRKLTSISFPFRHPT